MKTVSVINIKGGVGKTTLAANLGAYAASQGRRVLMIDLDPQASLTFSFMMPEEWRNLYADNMTMKNYFDAAARDMKIPSLSSLAVKLDMGDDLNLEDKKFNLICSHLGLVGTDIKLASHIFAHDIDLLASTTLKVCSYLRKSLSEIQDDYDLVLIDCPPNTNIVVRNALVASDCYIVPAKMDYLSTLGVTQLEESIKDHLKEYNEFAEQRSDSDYETSSLSNLGIVPMMVSILKDGSKGREIISSQQEFMDGLKEKGCYVFSPVRNNSTVFGAAPADGIPVVLTHPKFYNQTARKIVRELQELGEEFMKRLGI